MKQTKTIGIIACILLLTTAITPFVGAVEIKQQPLNPGVVDQEQNSTTTIHWLPPTTPNWQQFVHNGNILEEVELYFGCYYGGSAPVKLSIEETLGTPLTEITYLATDFPANIQTWFTFDVPDVKLKRDTTYYIVVRFDVGSEYGWSGDTGNPYPSGGSSHTDPNWDYAFRTIVDKSKPIDIQHSFLLFLKNHPRIFPVLQYLLSL